MCPAGIRRHRAWPAAVLAVALLGYLVGASGVQAQSGGTGNELRVRVVGLPPGAKPALALRGSGVRASGQPQLLVFSGIRPGAYTLAVRPVHLRPVRPWLPEGGTAYPLARTVAVQVGAGSRAQAVVNYATIESAAAHRLTGQPLSVTGPANNPSSIKLPRSAAAKAGTILVARPSPELPAGLFHYVVRAQAKGAAELESLRPAKVSEVYPSLYLNGRFPVTGGATGSSQTAPFQWSVSDWPSQCAQPTSYSSGVSLAPTFEAKRFALHRGTASGTLLSGLSGSISLNLPVYGSSQCAASYGASAPWIGFINVGGTVPIPYFAQPSFLLGWNTTDAFNFQASGSIAIKAGVRFASGHATPIFAGQSQLTGSLGHNGQVSTSDGFASRWGIGLPQASLAFVQLAPTAYGKAEPCQYGDQMTLTGGLGSRPGKAGVSRNYSLRSLSCTQRTLTVTSAGNGTGSVTSSPGGIGCELQCSVKLDAGTQVTVTAAPASGSSFEGWSGAGCSGTDPCTMTLSSDQTVTAMFAANAQASDPSELARTQLISLLESPKQATGAAYEVSDGTGHTLDTIKIIPSPAGGYLGVYHSLINGAFQVRLATSSDLTHWAYKTTLDQNASQPTITQLTNGGFLVVDEKALSNGTSHLRFLAYADLSHLVAASPAATFDAPLTLSSSHEGTPDIRSTSLAGSVATSQIQVGFHYNNDILGGDREALGTLTNFTQWSASPNTALNNAFNSPIPANIGDRDFIEFAGFPFTLVEAQLVPGDWTSWRVFLYDETAGSLTQLSIASRGGSTSFANPAVTTATDPAGNRALVVSYFLPYQGAAPGEAGPMIFYTEY